MTEPDMNGRGMNGRQDDDEKQDFLEKRGLSWAALVALLVVTLVVALVLAYLITVRNFPAH